VLAALIFIGVATLRWDAWVGGSSVQTTNDAYVRAEMTRLASRVAGEVRTVAVNDFQRVKSGDLLIGIDPADYEAQVAQAEAGVAGAKAALDNLDNQVELQYATIAQAEAQRVSAEARDVEAQQEQARQQALTQTQAGTRQKLEQAVADYAKAQADVRASRAVIAAQRHQLEVLAGTKKQRTADLLGAQATLAAARLRLGYTRIVAPFDGVVGERQVQQGDYVNIGSSLINIVPLPNVYVIANYKETQLTRVRPGQPVEVTIDTFPDQTLRGTVQRVSPASGSQFALLPPALCAGLAADPPGARLQRAAGSQHRAWPAARHLRAGNADDHPAQPADALVAAGDRALFDPGGVLAEFRHFGGGFLRRACRVAMAVLAGRHHRASDGAVRLSRNAA
jgi:membrane fusion protein (multidrug efflux system)